MLQKGYPRVTFIKQIRLLILNLGDYLLILRQRKIKALIRNISRQLGGMGCGKYGVPKVVGLGCLH